MKRTIAFSLVVGVLASAMMGAILRWLGMRHSGGHAVVEVLVVGALVLVAARHRVAVAAAVNRAMTRGTAVEELAEPDCEYCGDTRALLEGDSERPCFHCYDPPSRR